MMCPAGPTGGGLEDRMASSPGSTCSSASSSASSPPHQQQQQRKVVSEHRRCNKPIMEKKRRARINNCLDELKNLILDAMKKDPARHSKLEKADILEMTVKHLESLQRHQMALTAAADPNVLNKYHAGFSECATEVGRFLGRADSPSLDPHVRRRLQAHLSNCLNSVTGESPSPSPAPAETTTIRVQLPAGQAGQVMQLVPTCLPSGDIAFVLPRGSREVGEESRQSRAARTAVVAPLSVALDLTIAHAEDPKSKPQEAAEEQCTTGLDSEEGPVWRPW